MEIKRRDWEFDVCFGETLYTFRYLTVRQWPECRSAVMEANKGEDLIANRAKIMAAIARYAVGWKGVPVSFSVDAFVEGVQNRHMDDLIDGFLSEQNPQIKDLGNSPLPASLPLANTVLNASTDAGK